MTEKEYQIEMLCCLPNKLLSLRLNNSDKIPDWLKGIETDLIKEAINLYNTPKYVMLRQKQKESLF